MDDASAKAQPGEPAPDFLTHLAHRFRMTPESALSMLGEGLLRYERVEQRSAERRRALTRRIRARDGALARCAAERIA